MSCLFVQSAQTLIPDNLVVKRLFSSLEFSLSHGNHNIASEVWYTLLINAFNSHHYYYGTNNIESTLMLSIIQTHIRL